jgi:hypothetical protein
VPSVNSVVNIIFTPKPPGKEEKGCICGPTVVVLNQPLLK